MNQKQYDAIVIGSGIGGLTAAVELAKEGARVLVLEQHYLFGGACTTYTRKGGFQFDAGVESISGIGDHGPVTHLLQRHGISDKVEWKRNSYEFRRDEEVFSIPQDFFSWRDQLISRYPEEAEGLRGFFQACKDAFEEMYSVFAPDRVTPRLPRTREEMMHFVQTMPTYLKWRESTWGEFLDGFIQHPPLRQQLSMLTGYVGDMGEATPSSSMLPIMGYFIVGGFRPAGGSGNLAAVLVKKLREYGGEAVLREEVVSLLLEQNQVKGVQTKKHTYYAPVVISNVDPRVTYERLIGLDRLPDDFAQKVTRLEPSMSVFSWSAALYRPFFTDRLISCRFSQPIYLPENDMFIEGYGIHSAAKHDPSLAPEGCGTVYVIFKTKPQAAKYGKMGEAEYQRKKTEIDEVCQTFLRQIDPEAAEAILFSEVATPKTVESYLGTHEGSIYSSKIDKNSGFPSIISPIEGLYLASAGVGNGPGIEAVVITGAEAAEIVAAAIRAKAGVATS